MKQRVTALLKRMKLAGGTDKVKILLDATVLQEPVTGVARAMLGLYTACAALQPDLRVVALHRKALRCNLPDRIGSRRLAPYLPAVLWRHLAIPAYTSLKRADVIHFPWNGGVTWVPRPTLVVLTLHDVIPAALPCLYFQTEQEEENYRKRVQRNLDLADLVITDSECSKRDILAHFRLKRDPVVVYLANLLLTRSLDGIEKPLTSQGYFLYVGGYERRKGLESLVREYQRLHAAREIGIPLVLAGEPQHVSDALKATISAAKSEGSIIEREYVTDHELACLLQNARALIYPSLHEGFGYPPLEAMAQGCPVITTRVSSMPEICGEAALYVAPGDSEGLASAILEMDRNAELRLKLSRMGRERAALFTWEKSAKKYLETLEDIRPRNAVAGSVDNPPNVNDGS